MPTLRAEPNKPRAPNLSDNHASSPMPVRPVYARSAGMLVRNIPRCTLRPLAPSWSCDEAATYPQCKPVLLSHLALLSPIFNVFVRSSKIPWPVPAASLREPQREHPRNSTSMSPSADVKQISTTVTVARSPMSRHRQSSASRTDAESFSACVRTTVPRLRCTCWPRCL